MSRIIFSIRLNFVAHIVVFSVLGFSFLASPLILMDQWLLWSPHVTRAPLLFHYEALQSLVNPLLSNKSKIPHWDGKLWPGLERKMRRFWPLPWVSWMVRYGKSNSFNKSKSMLSRYNGLPANCLTNAFTLPVKQRFVTEGWCLIRVTYTSEYRIYTGLNNIILSTQEPFSSPATRLWTCTRLRQPCIRLFVLNITECRYTRQSSSWTVSKLCWKE